MSFPVNVKALYWDADGANWPSDSRARLSSYPTELNVLIIAFAVPVGGAPGTTGAMQFTLPNGAAGTNLVADIQTCRARGQRVLLSCGGGGNHVTLGSQARADAFIASIKAINEQLGGAGSVKAVDGIDLNIFETATADGQWMAYIGQQLKAFYGEFLITAPPSATDYDGSATNNRLALAQMYNAGAMDLLNPQHYDGPGLATSTNVNLRAGFYHTAVDIGGGTMVTIPQNRIGIGFGILAGQPSNTWWTAADAASAYTANVAAGHNPKGAVNWSAKTDPANAFAATVAPVITNNVSPGNTCSGIAAMSAGSFTL
jgi:chitinase